MTYAVWHDLPSFCSVMHCSPLFGLLPEWPCQIGAILPKPKPCKEWANWGAGTISLGEEVSFNPLLGVALMAGEFASRGHRTKSAICTARSASDQEIFTSRHGAYARAFRSSSRTLTKFLFLSCTATRLVSQEAPRPYTSSSLREWLIL